ncbi:ensconsin-like [Osmerus eperlanus]|uniref:ensconsin-like n=1 Tax=Osmerus eperlanus TaxID=29151 RepID=UPI002E130B2D
MSGFPGKKRMDKKKKERTPAVKSGPQIQAEQRWARKMQAAQKDAETRLIIKRWVDLKKTLQKPREKRLAELREAEKRLAEDSRDMQRQERWREWRQKERELWEAEQRQKEQELNSKKKLEILQETKTPHTQVLKSPTILEELKILDELLEETADIKLPSMSPVHQPVSPTPTPLPLGKDGAYLGLTTTKPLEAQARHPHGVKHPTCTPLPEDTQIYTHPMANQEEGLESGLAKLQVQEASVEESSNSDMLMKIENEIKAEEGKAAKKEREFIEKQKKAEKLAQEKMEKKQRKQLEQAEKRNMEIQTKLENERCKMKALERKEMQRLAEEQRQEMKKKEKEEKKAEKGQLEMGSLPKYGFFEKIKRAFHFH